MTGDRAIAIISLEVTAGIVAGLAFDFWRASRKEVCWEFRKMSIWFATLSILPVAGCVYYIWLCE